MNTYDVGDRVRVSAKFTIDEVDSDPGTVTVKILPPSGVPVVYVYGVDAEVIKDSTGDYHLDYDVVEEREHHYRFEGTGASRGAAEARFFVRKSAFTEES